MRMLREYEEGPNGEHMTGEQLAEALAQPPDHPGEEGLRKDRLPHIWCPGCGIGTTMSTMMQAIREAKIDMNNLAMVSGIGCSGRVSGYTDCDSFHTTHGRAIPFALGLHVANPKLEVVVFSGDGDLMSIGGNHLIHAARRNAAITVFCVNNFNYGMTGGQHGATSQTGARTITTPYGNVEYSFNLPQMVASAGGTYVARWTILDLGRLRRSMVEALEHDGFAFVEVISPCPIYYGRFNKKPDPIDSLRYYRDAIEVKENPTLEDAQLTLNGKIVVGKYMHRQAPTLNDLVHDELFKRAQAKGKK